METANDLEHIEAGGCIEGAEPEEVSERAMERGRDQLGTLGSGNHFVEVGYVAEVFDEKVAQALGLWKDQVTVFVHTGSRGLGHQVCDDYIRLMMDAARKYQIELPDPQLCCAPVSSPEGERYLKGHGERGQLCLYQPPDDQSLGQGDLRARFTDGSERSESGSDL